MNRLSVCIILCAVLNILFSPLFAQESARKDLAKAVQEADILFYYDENYEKAALLYEALCKDYPDNANFAAKLGFCCLNIDGRKQDALKLLKKASANVTEKDNDYVEHGEKAPTDTYLYLGVAYHVNDSLEQAIKMFSYAKEKYDKADKSKIKYIDNQIISCRYAIEMKKKPITIIPNLFIPWLDDYPGAINPVLAKNDSIFIFTRKTEGKTRILCSYKKDRWTTPVDITRELGGYTRFYTNSITGDGKLLILFLDDGGDGNLYYSQRNDTTWSKVKSMGRNINTIYWESHGFITPDGNTIYISSNRPGGEGELDIWKSEKEEDGSWAKPVNCGNKINTPYNENTPFFDPATGALIFSSAGHVSMGDYDVFRAVARNGGWTDPVGMPFAFNTTSANTFFILNNNAPGFITSLYDTKGGSRNIYSVAGVDPADEITVADGIIRLLDANKIDIGKALVRLNDNRGRSIIDNIPLNAEGKFKFEIRPGDYQVITSYKDYQTDTVTINIPLYFLSHYISLSVTLLPEVVVTGIFLTMKTVFFEFNSYELDETARSNLDEVKSILITHPDLKIEVAGYTDAIGSTEFNYKLADKRAQAVIDYMVSPINPPSRFIKKSFGESLFASLNTNPDGSDNPEGRKYNRRVTFGVVDPQTGIVLRQETYTPEHLRLPSSMKYSIILKESTERLPESDFDILNLSGKLFLRTIQDGSIYLYAIGVFYNESDAIEYLGFVMEKGFTDASIINQYELNNKSKLSAKASSVTILATGKRIYTIQVLEAKSPVSMDLFKDIKGIREILGDDGYYRYVIGEFSSESQAQEALAPIKEAGFNDAVIRELNQLIPQ
jgi:outer membrane protein OmpA-like peptidoglycan-associated protein/tetratricopeptide (TPR) repeat protein